MSLGQFVKAVQDEIKDVHIGLLLRRAYRAHTRVVNASLGQVGMTSQHYYVLMALNNIDGQDQVTLSRDLHVEKAALTPIIKVLIEQRFIRRAPHAEDGRKILIYLTKKGRQFARDNLGRMEVIRDLAIAGIPAKELKVTVSALELIVKNLLAALD